MGSDAGSPLSAMLWRRSIVVTMTFLIIGSFWFWHWYLLWVVVLAALLPTSRFTTTVLPICCAGALWLYIASDFLIRRGRAVAVIAPTNRLGGITWLGLVAGVFVVVALWRALRLADGPGNVLEPLWKLGGRQDMHDPQLVRTPAEQSE